jgi:fructose-specific phosphotransferase system IIC component
MTTVPGSIPKIILDCIALNKSIKIITNFVVGPLVFVLLATFIYWQITRQHDWHSSLQAVLSAVKGPQQWKLWLVLALMPLNWGRSAASDTGMHSKRFLPAPQ